MKILALIPARGGSKRLPGKNVKLLGGLPLIAWTIRSACESGCCAEVLVSTDSLDIAAVAREYGASVPWLRPSELSTDTANSVDVAIHALNAYEMVAGSVDGLLLLQPTSPFRSSDSIKRAIEMFREVDGKQPIVSVSPASTHPNWCFRIKPEGMEPFVVGAEAETRSQDLEPAWALNGSIYLISPGRLRTERRFLTEDAKPLLITDMAESIDVDTAIDFELCEARVKNAKKN